MGGKEEKHGVLLRNHLRATPEDRKRLMKSKGSEQPPYKRLESEEGTGLETRWALAGHPNKEAKSQMSRVTYPAEAKSQMTQEGISYS